LFYVFVKISAAYAIFTLSVVPKVPTNEQKIAWKKNNKKKLFRD